MKKLILCLICIFLLYIPFFAQVEDSLSKKESGNNSGLLREWNYSFGYRQTNLSHLNSRLFSGNSNGFAHFYLTGHIGFNIFLYKKVTFGVELSPYFVPNILSKPNHDHYFSGINSGLHIGYTVLKSRKFGIDLGYGLGFDYNSLLIQRVKNKSTSFEDASNTPLTAMLSSFNTAHRIGLRFRSFSPINENCNLRKQNSWSLEVGYTLAGINKWTDFNLNEIAGPSLDNSGLFIRLIYAQQRQKSLRIQE